MATATRPKSGNLNIRINPDVKNNAEKLYAQFGLTISDAINIFLHQSLLEGGLPFQIRQPRYNDVTEAAIEEGRKIARGEVKVKSYSSAEELFAELEAEEDEA